MKKSNWKDLSAFKLNAGSEHVKGGAIKICIRYIIETGSGKIHTETYIC